MSERTAGIGDDMRQDQMEQEVSKSVGTVEGVDD
jgi:hypothetical protein